MPRLHAGAQAALSVSLIVLSSSQLAAQQSSPPASSGEAVRLPRIEVTVKKPAKRPPQRRARAPAPASPHGPHR